MKLLQIIHTKTRRKWNTSLIDIFYLPHTNKHECMHGKHPDPHRHQ